MLTRARSGRLRVPGLPDEQAEIKAYITAITFGNLVGNSADAWLARLRRIPVEGGHPVGEAIAALAASRRSCQRGHGAARGDQRRSSRCEFVLAVSPPQPESKYPAWSVSWPPEAQALAFGISWIPTLGCIPPPHLPSSSDGPCRVAPGR